MLIFLGSVLTFHKIIKREGSRVLLDNGEYVAFRKGEYFKKIPNWERITYTLFKTKKDCINYIKEHYEEYKDFNLEKDLDKLLNQACFNG